MRTFALSRSLLIAALLWIPNVHHFFKTDAEDRAKLGDALATHRVADAEAEVLDLRASNPEWDFMSRTFTVLALASRATDMPDERERDLQAIDHIVDDAIAEDTMHGDAYFLLPYAKRGKFRDPEGRSVFIDGEILAMLSARNLVEPRPARNGEAAVRAARIEREMRRGPVMSAESYPNECWTFCNTTALAALAMYDASSGTDHTDLSRAWIETAKTKLTDPSTGLLVSSFEYDGATRDGPEGSTIWMSATNLLFIDEPYAKDQYTRAKREIGASFAGFGWAREWPKSSAARPDVDSGPIVPLLDASAGSSGFALLGASAFEDRAWQGELFSSLELAGFRDDATGRYRASNGVGDAVMLYAVSFGPLLNTMKTRAHAREALR